MAGAFFSSCAFRRMSRYKTISCLGADDAGRRSMNVFAPVKQQDLTNIIVSVGDDSGNSGKKSPVQHDL